MVGLKLPGTESATEMSKLGEGHDALYVERLLAGAAATIAGVRYCWLTSSADGSVRSRPMGRLLPSESDDDWTIRFVTDRRSRKATDLRRSAMVSLTFQNDRDDAFVCVAGPARLIEEAPDVGALWNEDYRPYFPTETDRASVGFIEVRITRMELWIRGVTPEPFGLRTTVLERDPQSAWHRTV